MKNLYSPNACGIKNPKKILVEVINPTNLLKVNSKNTRNANGTVLVSLLLTLNIFHTLF